ncbi:MAG: nitrogen fixation protein [Rhodospirillales bacterium]|nr:nitrogen fixation protein [Rhodospirillales bacterium]
MKFAVTSQNFRTVTPHAGRARRFLVFEAEEGAEPKEVDRLDLAKELAMHDWHGTGAHPLDAVDVLIAGSFGEGFGQRMASRGIVAVRTDKTDPFEAVKDYLAGKLAPAGPSCDESHHHQHQHAHAHGHGHGHGHAHGQGHGHAHGQGHAEGHAHGGCCCHHEEGA